jgi:hypothetical protein
VGAFFSMGVQVGDHWIVAITVERCLAHSTRIITARGLISPRWRLTKLTKCHHAPAVRLHLLGSAARMAVLLAVCDIESELVEWTTGKTSTV